MEKKVVCFEGEKVGVLQDTHCMYYYIYAIEYFNEHCA